MSLQAERWRIWRNVLVEEQRHEQLGNDFYYLGSGFYVHCSIGQTGYVVLIAFKTASGIYRSKYYAANVRSSPLTIVTGKHLYSCHLSFMVNLAF